jgi:TonB family protein
MMMHLERILLVWLLIAPGLFFAQSPVEEGEVGPNDWVLLEKEPVPTNLNTLKGLIGYPPKAKEANIQGKVLLRVQINEQGNYVKHIVVKDPHPYLTDAVTSKIHNIKFVPGIQKGKPIKVWVTIPFDFKLLDDPAPKLNLDSLPPPPKITYHSLEEALEADPNNVIDLILNGKDLKAFPMEILNFKRLHALELGDNALTAIPSEISSLKSLRYLGLSRNQLTSLPESIWTIPNLKRIQIEHNMFPQKVQKTLSKDHGDILFPKGDNGKVDW